MTVPVRTVEELLAAAVRALRLLEWSERSDIDYARAGLMEAVAPYTGYHCMVCRGVNSAGSGIRGKGHRYWCAIADLLAELGEEVEREPDDPAFVTLRGLLRKAADAGQLGDELDYPAMVCRANGLDKPQVIAKMYRDLGLEVPDGIASSTALAAV